MAYSSEIWPRTVSFQELLMEVRKRLGSKDQGEPPTSEDAHNLATQLLSLYGYASNVLVEFHFYPLRFASSVAQKPITSPLVRWQASRGNQVTNVRHELVTLNNAERHIVGHLDGSCDRVRLRSLLDEFIDTDESHSDNSDVDLEKMLSSLAQKALLVENE